jgi:hypothetical protein
VSLVETRLLTLSFPKYLVDFYAENVASSYAILINIDSIDFYQNFKFSVCLQDDFMAYKLRDAVQSKDGC